MSEVISSFKSLSAGSQVFALIRLFLCVIYHTMWSGKSPQLLCILPFGMVCLSAISKNSVYLFMADIANPELFVCGCRTWICLDISLFYEELRQPYSVSTWPACPKNGKSGGFDTICTTVCDRCDSSTACRLCGLEPSMLCHYSDPAPCVYCHLRGYHTMFLIFLFYMQLSHLYIYHITILQIKCFTYIK